MSAQLALELRDDGMARARLHAGDAWVEVAVADFVGFVKARPEREATCEQWRFDWLSRGLPEPDTHKCYGNVPMIAARRGYVVNTGRYVIASSPKTHGHRVPYWRAT